MNGISDTDLLLIGKTGNGKSATGNSILRRRAFKSVASTASVTKTVDFEVSDFNGRIIKVVDCPGVGDTSMNNEEGVQFVMKSMNYAIDANPRGYHAILIVVRFGGRFTAEDVETINFLKKVFGDTFVKDFCILVLTCGDNFDEDETGQTFQEWCRKQDGHFKTLFEECDNRAILFDNKTKDYTIRCDQLTTLLKIVDNLRFRGNRYTDDHFARAREARERAMVEAKIPMIREDTVQETSLILQKLQELESQQDLREKIKLLNILKIRAEKFFKKVCSEDKGTGALKEFIKTAKRVQGLVDEDIRFTSALMKEREENRIRQEEFKKVIQKRMDQQKREYEDLEEKYQQLKEKVENKSKCSIS